MTNKEWVILDTDIGGDIDDTWALLLLLKMEKYDVKLITITGYDTYYQIRLVAKLLTLAQRTDIPIAYNIPQDKDGGPQERWLEDFSLDHYQGKIYLNTLKAMKKIVKECESTINLLSIGAKTNVAELFRNCNEALDKCVLYSMQSDLEGTYRETNVRMDIQAARQVMAFGVEKHIMPTSVCGHTWIEGDLYNQLLSSIDPMVKAMIENYKIWWEDCDWNHKKQNPDQETSILYDPITLLYMYDKDNFIVDKIKMSIDFDGFTHINVDKGHLVNCVMAIKDEEKIKKDIVNILLIG